MGHGDHAAERDMGVRVREAAGTHGEKCGLSEEEAGQRHRDTPQGQHQSHAGIYKCTRGYII